MNSKLKKTALLFISLLMYSAMFGNNLVKECLTDGTINPVFLNFKCRSTGQYGGPYYSVSFSGAQVGVSLTSSGELLLGISKSDNLDLSPWFSRKSYRFEQNMLLRSAVIDQLGLNAKYQYYVPEGEYEVTADPQCYYLVVPLRFTVPPNSRYSITLNSDP
ncbi:MAG: hypothetical protein U0T73_10790 [Chitinophagales bacterium]